MASLIRNVSCLTLLVGPTHSRSNRHWKPILSATDPAARPGSNLDYPLSARPELGETMTIAPGVNWVHMRLPMQLNHINLWLLEDAGGWAVVDTGINDTTTADAWKMLF